MSAFLEYAGYRFAISSTDAVHLCGALLGAMFLYGGASFAPRAEYEAEINRLIMEAAAALPYTPSTNDSGIGPIDVLGARILRLFDEKGFGLEQAGGFTRVFIDFMKNSAGINIETVVRATPILQLLLRSTGYRHLSQPPVESERTD